MIFVLAVVKVAKRDVTAMRSLQKWREKIFAKSKYVCMNLDLKMDLSVNAIRRCQDACQIIDK